MESGEETESSEFKMQYKLYDAIIFGATGFTGKVVVETAVELLKDYKWAIAGRNKEKLERLLDEIGLKLGTDLNHVPIIIADVGDEQSITEMAKLGNIILNCCGPYKEYGEVVVKACIEQGTHHVDISGEPMYIDGMQLKYHELAKEKGVYVISTCAFDSLPADLGVVYAEKQFEGTINSIDMYWENDFKPENSKSKTVLHYATYESAIIAMRDGFKTMFLQRKINKQLQIPKLRPKACNKICIQKPDFSERYFLPLPFGDRDVVERSQRRLFEIEQKRPIQFHNYVGFRSLLFVLYLPIHMFFILLFSQICCTFKMLLKYPNFFTFGRITHEGPTLANQNALSFRMTFKCKGWAKGEDIEKVPPKKKIITRVSGTSPFYKFTSIGLISTAKTILEEKDKMPGSGGVLPPGAAFYRTGLIEELSRHQHGLKFEVIQQ